MRSLLVVTAIIIVISFLSAIANGESVEEQIRIETEKRKALEKTELKILEGEGRFAVDYGGWINFRYDDYTDDDNDSSVPDTLDYTSSLDSRLWMKATLKPPPRTSYKNEHSLYIRLKDIHIASRPEEINGGYYHHGPNLDYAYVIFDLRPCWFEIGRRYFSVGQGIAYGNLHDGVELLISLENWNWRALVSQTHPDEENIDTSVPGWELENDRVYYGVEGTYLGISNQGIYGYLLVQRDKNDEKPEDPLRDYTYDSTYIGLGAQGKIIAAMHYWAELIREIGESHVYATGEKRDINTWGGDFGITYDLDVYSNPNFTIEYAFGLGDEDRISVTDTLGGNIFGDDRNFLYFGYLPAGYAFSGRLSNIHFIKAGVLLKPLERYQLFKNFTFGIDYYRYYKDKEDGGISDIDASISDDDIGSEIDMNISWQILSDLSCSLEYGHFEPGGAYPDSADDSETYLSFGVTITF